MSINRFHFAEALRSLGNAEVFIGAFDSAAVSVPGAAVDPAPANTGNGTFSAIVGKANAPSEVISIGMTSATTFTVTGSLSGAQTAGVALGAYVSHPVPHPRTGCHAIARTDDHRGTSAGPAYGRSSTLLPTLQCFAA